jgi:CRISPR-associated protein Csm2
MSKNNPAQFKHPSPDELKQIITDPDAAETLVRCAKDIGEGLARQLTTNQIRAIFGEVRKIEGEWKTRPQRANRNLILLKPKMAYRAKKERGRGVDDLVSVLSPAIDHVDGNGEHFTRFVDFFEAILAYHKAGGGI